MDMDFQLPKKGKKLFTSTDKYLEFSHFGWGDVNSQFYGYVKGYKESADTLVKFAVDSKNISILDTYIFPILFLYRQFIELSMKSLYLQYLDDTMSDKIDAIKKTNHNLAGMWNKLKPTLLNVSDSEEEKEKVKVVESYILQYHNFDKSSFKFRYPIDKEINPLLKNEERIDIVNLKDCMTELDNYFSGYDGKLDSYRESKYEQEQYLKEIEEEMKAEMEAEMKANMDWY